MIISPKTRQSGEIDPLKQIILTGFLFICCFLCVFAQTGSNPHSSLTIGESYRIYPGNLNQTEVFIVNSPVNPDVLWVSCNTLNFIPFFISEGIYTTIDGGSAWRGNDTCTGSPIGFHGGDPGITINQNGTFILTRMGRAPFVGLYSHYSTDNGQTWSSQKVISTDDLERAAVATNILPGTPGYGRTFAAWIKFAYPFPMMVAHTDNEAQSWSTPAQLNSPANRSAGGDIAIGPNGEVYICWAGVTDITPFKEILVGFASSVNGGTAWDVHENVFAMNGITGILAGKENIRVNGLPGIDVDVTNGERRGWIYIVTGQKDLAPAGSDPDIVLNRSIDGGKTWSAGIRVNQDALNNGKTQYFPAVHVDKTGAVNVLFYDDRATTGDSAGVFLARSVDGGDTFTEYEICDHHFKPKPIGGLGQGYQGDNIDLTSTDTHLWPVWMDNYTGTYQIWTVPIAISELNGLDDNELSLTKKPMTRVYPNPFSKRTTIRYRVNAAGPVTLRVFDIMGRQIAELVNESKSSGQYQTEFAPGNQATEKYADVYYYHFSSVSGVEVGKMICVE